MRYLATVAAKQYEIELAEAENDTVMIDGCRKKVDFKRIGPSLYTLLIDNRAYRFYIRQHEAGFSVYLNHRKYLVSLEDERTRLLRRLIKRPEGATGPTPVKAPMPGLIVKFNVDVGQEVQAGDSLAIIEAMKMENEIRAKSGGKVVKLMKAERESVEKDTILMWIE